MFQNRAKKGIEFFYNVFTTNSSTPAGQHRWVKNLLDNNLPWEKFYLLNRWANPDSATRAFQYKLLHRILPTNIFLKSIRVINDDKCSMCKNEKETLEHIFIHCPFTKILWDDLELYISQKLNCTIKLNVSEKLFGAIQESKALNHILTLTRKHIYFSKQREKKPNIQDLIKYITQIIHLEKYNAKINQTTENFKTKWRNFINSSTPSITSTH